MMSAAQSTSIPSLRMTSARSSRFAVEVSTRSTRFFLRAPGAGAKEANKEWSSL